MRTSYRCIGDPNRLFIAKFTTRGGIREPDNDIDRARKSEVGRLVQGNVEDVVASEHSTPPGIADLLGAEFRDGEGEGRAIGGDRHHPDHQVPDDLEKSASIIGGRQSEDQFPGPTRR